MPGRNTGSLFGRSNGTGSPNVQMHHGKSDSRSTGGIESEQYGMLVLVFALGVLVLVFEKIFMSEHDKPFDSTPTELVEVGE